MMIVKIDIECYNREMLVMFDEMYSRERDKIRDIMENAYRKWMDLDDLSDDEYDAIHDMTVEDYIIETLENEGYEILTWDSIEYEEE